MQRANGVLNLSTNEVNMFSIAEIEEALENVFCIAGAPSLRELREETFSDKSRVHNWRNYVPKNEWKDFTDLERLIYWFKATNEANNEEWD